MGLMDDVQAYFSDPKNMADLKARGGAAIRQAFGSIPGGSSAVDIASNAGPLMDEAAKSPAVQNVANAVTGGSGGPEAPNAGNPLSSGVNAAVASAIPTPDAQTGGATRSWDATATPAPAPAENVAPDASTPPVSAPQSSVTPPSADLASLVNSNSADNAARIANDAALAHQRKMALIPGAIGAFGDAVTAGANARSGGHEATDTASKIIAGAKQNETDQKALFDTKLKNDPTSDVSKAYRAMVQQIVPDMAKNPAFANMSAQAIGDKLPMIDTMMKAQAAKDSKEVGMAQANAYRNMTLGVKQGKDDETQMAHLSDALDPSKQRSGTFADAQKRVNGVKRLEALFQGYNNNLTPQEWEEASLAWANVLGQGTSGGSRAQVEALVPSSARGNMQKTIQWVTNNPTGTAQQAFAQRMQQGMAREKKVNEDLVHNSQLDRLGRAQGVAQRQPDQVRNQLEGYGINYDEVSKRYPEVAKKLWPQGRPKSDAAPSATPATPQGQRKTASGHTYTVQ